MISLDRLGAKSGLIAPIASWGDTLSDEDVLEQLSDYNAKFLPLHESHLHMTEALNG